MGWKKKEKPLLSEEETAYIKLTRRKKILMMLVLIAATAIVALCSFRMFSNKIIKRVDPQIARAMVQISRRLPELEKDEQALRDVYDQMVDSWKELVDGKYELNRHYGIEMSDVQDDEDLEDLVNRTLSWTNTVSQIMVGGSGYVMAVDDQDTIIAHPDWGLVGKKVTYPVESLSEVALTMGDIPPGSMADNLSFESVLVSTEAGPLDTDYYWGFGGMLHAGVLYYNGVYLVCGVPITEIVLYTVGQTLFVSFVFFVVIWLFVRYISLMLERHEERRRVFRTKLLSYFLLNGLIIFGLTFYLQVLTDITTVLRTMERYAVGAAMNLAECEEEIEEINTWLDWQYLKQCYLAAIAVDLKGVENLTRVDMENLAEELGVEYVYVFDQSGKVVVTNSPFDHYELSKDPEASSYEFRQLLNGTPEVVQEPILDKYTGDYIQYIGISTRDEEDLCNGFVEIAVDPALRNSLVGPLRLRKVLDKLIIGQPEDALAIDKEELKVVETTGVGYPDDTIEDLQITEEDLTGAFTGFLTIDGTTYYAGVEESEDYYLIPLMEKKGNGKAATVSFAALLIGLCAMLGIFFIGMFRYHRRHFEREEATEENGENQEEDDEEGEAVKDKEAQDELGVFSDFTKLFKTHDDKQFEERWKMDTESKETQSPEKRMKSTIYKIITVLCIAVVVPWIYYMIHPDRENELFSVITYVLMGRWQKGINIFAFTACVYLLCGIYVLTVLFNRILYLIARISDSRVETVCLLLRNSLKYIAGIIFIYYGLAQFGVDTRTLLASAGILSLMISFGAKDLVSDVISGFFIIFEGTCKVGDFITIGSWYGTVQEIGIRTTRVSFFADTKIFNNSSVKDIVNANGEVARMVLKVPVSYQADLEKVEDILKEELEKLTEEQIPGLVSPPQYQGVQEFGQNNLLLRIAIYTESYKRNWAYRRLSREVRLIFARNNIEIPYEQVVVHQAPESAADLAVKEISTPMEKRD